LWSATSYKSLRDEAMQAERWSRLHPEQAARIPLVTQKLASAAGPVVAVTDYQRSVPDMISRWCPSPWVSLGTDGFGRSDTRERLRRYFETDAPHVTLAVLQQLCLEGKVTADVVADAINRYRIDVDSPAPWTL
jgi:pyruvate dehydrogenase E1 component